LITEQLVNMHIAQLISLDLNSANWQCSCILKIATRKQELLTIYENLLCLRIMQNSIWDYCSAISRTTTVHDSAEL